VYRQSGIGLRRLAEHHLLQLAVAAAAYLDQKTPRFEKIVADLAPKN
jgi:hypothetical protein